jgi:hypothetical protein
MLNRYYLEELDRFLRDLMTTDGGPSCLSRKPFGGKIVIIAGDFRQTLPVMQRAGRAQIIGACLKKSPLWRLFHKFKLTENMRVRLNGHDQKAEEYARWLLDVGNGVVQPGVLKRVDAAGNLLLNVPPELRIDDESELIDWTFVNLGEGEVTGAILCTRNNIVDSVNVRVAAKFPGEEVIVHSADALMLEDSGRDIPTEYLNGTTPNGLPPHELRFKKGMPVMLLRNLDPHNKMCNGTRMVVVCVRGFVLECKVKEEGDIWRTVLIPRLNLEPKEDEFPFKWRRRQFPVRLSFAMTVNKSQGQTFHGRVGLLLPDPVFSHGQLYVACSRTVHPNNMRICVLHDPPVVYGEPPTCQSANGAGDQNGMTADDYDDALRNQDEEDMMRDLEDEGNDHEVEEELFSYMDMLEDEWPDDHKTWDEPFGYEYGAGPDEDEEEGPDEDEEAEMRDAEDQVHGEHMYQPDAGGQQGDDAEQGGYEYEAGPDEDEEEGPDEDEEAEMRDAEDNVHAEHMDQHAAGEQDGDDESEDNHCESYDEDEDMPGDEDEMAYMRQMSERDDGELPGDQGDDDHGAAAAAAAAAVEVAAAAKSARQRSVLLTVNVVYQEALK